MRITCRSHTGYGAGAAASTLLFLALGGCDLQRLTGSLATPGAVPRLSEEGTGTLGSAFLSTPASSHPTDVHSTTAQPFAAVPADTWTVIRASGSVQQTWNEDCNDVRGDWVCSTGGVLPPFSETPWTLGPVAFRAEYDDGTGAELPMRGMGENAAVGLFRAPRAATLTGKLNLWARWLFKPGQIGIPSYYLTGGFSVSATAIDAPMGLTAGGPDESGGREYSVEPLHGLEFVNPTDLYHLIHPGTILWYFYRGENVSETPAGEANRVPINACAYQRTCYYVPTGPGRVQVSAYVEGRQVVLRSRPVQEGALELTCPESVQRGSVMTCTATVPGSMSITGWRFDATDRTDGDPTSSTWGGVMVKSGTIEVVARNGSNPVSATAEVQVTDRTWPTAPLVSVREIGNGTHPLLTLAPSITYAHDLGAANWFRRARYEDNDPDPIGYVSGGPNDGLYYFEDLSFPIHALYVINRAAMTQGSAFYNAQVPNTSGGGTTIGGTNWCSRSVVSGPLAGLVEAHELRHIDVYSASFRDELAPVLPSLEPLVGSYDELSNAYDGTFDRIDLAARTASNAIHASTGNPNNVVPSNSRGPCALKSESGTRLENRP